MQNDSAQPISYVDILRARNIVSRYLPRTPFRNFPVLDAAIGHNVQAFVKLENHLPTQSFKARNGIVSVTALTQSGENVQSRRISPRVIAATRGNHGLGLAWAGRQLGVPVTICVPLGNNPQKNSAMKALGAELIESGDDYDASLEEAGAQIERRSSQGESVAMIHSTNNVDVLAGASTLAAEMLEDQPTLDALVICVGGGSQIVGAISVLRHLAPSVPIYGVQAANASACHDSWHAGKPVETESAQTIADGMATRKTYAMTFPCIQQGLEDFVTVSETELEDAVRLYYRNTQNLAEPAGAAGLAGLRQLAPRLAGKRVGIVLSGGNIDELTLKQIVNRER